MKTIKILLFVMLSAVMLYAFMGSAKADEPRQDVLYTCDCGADCHCNSVSTKPGNCKCGKPMKWGHVLKIEGDEAILCTCAEGCKCTLDPKDPSKCGCGQPVKRVSLRGPGYIFAIAEAPACAILFQTALANANAIWI